MIYQVVVVTDTERVIIEYDEDFEGLLKSIIRDEDESVILTFCWIDQCNFELSPYILRFLSNRAITLGITTQEG